MDISIIIVNYKSKDLTLNCIKSICSADWPGLDYEIIVVDNYSGDFRGDDLKPFDNAHGKQFGDIKFIMNGRNIGMGPANNIGIKQAQGKYIVVMNPDTVATKDAFIKLYDFMEGRSKIGVVGPKQLNPDGGIQDSCFRWPGLLTPFLRRTAIGETGFGKKYLDRFLYKDYNKSSVRQVNWILGSFLFCRAEALRQAGLFDERFFLYFEDTDLCRRFWLMNWQVVYNPEIVITHNHARQSARLPWYKFYKNKAAWHHIASWARYLWKWKNK